MKFIKNLRIRDKLLILLFILLIPLVFFVFEKIQKEIEENAELKQVAVRLSESEKISTFIHEFQRERALIMSAYGSDSLFRSEAVAQRSRTDAAEADLKLFLESSNRSFSDLSLTNDLKRYRTDLDQGILFLPDFRKNTGEIIVAFLRKIDDNATDISNVSIRKELLSFVHLTEAKVHLSRMRSSLMMAIPAGRYTMEEFGVFVAQKDFYYSSLGDFKRYASGETRADAEKKLSNENHKKVEALIHAVDANPAYNLSRFDPMDVYQQFTISSEDLRETENLLISRIRNQVNNESARKETNLFMTTSVVLLMLGIAVLLSIYIVNLISHSLMSLKVAADKVRLGATDVVIDYESKDEIGKLADSFRGVVQKSITLSNVARAIGQGNYNVNVPVTGKEDQLSNSILEMKENLEKFSVESKNRNWVLSGVSELNNNISGESALNILCEKFISFLTTYSGSETGIVYLHDDSGSLIPTAIYGAKFGIEEIPAFRIGKGKVGQAVSDQQVVVLEEVEEEYVKIKSGLAEITPSSIVIVPLVFSDTKIGAVELSSRSKYQPLHLEFFRTVAERAAIVIHTLKVHLRTQELLYETQNQAEELETQQEELRQLNAELKASEEELKVNQEELQEKNAELEEKAGLLEEQNEAVRTKNKALEDARQAIELKMQQVEAVSKYKSDFLANMSHELRTPLNSILILSKLLSDNREKNLTEKQTEHAEIIHNSGSDLLKLINEILDLSKIESGQIKLDIADVSLKNINIEKAFSEVAANKKIDFKISYAPDIYETISTDQFRLEQIIKNFLSNAFKFTQKGGSVELSVYSVKDKRMIRSSQLKDAGEVIAFSVKDTGIGISPDKQDLIFEAFQQADTSTTRKYGGTGLGLTISKELAALLGGEIHLESEPGKGSNFILLLPRTHLQPVKKTIVVPEESVVKSEASMTEILDNMKATGKKEITILIIEDDKGFNRILADFALTKRFKVHQAFTGNEGLVLAREIKPDAVLLDINLPDISGWDVLREIREDKSLRHINVHVMSAYDREVTGNYQDNEEYLPKPVTLEMLDKAFTNISTITDKSIEKVLIVEDNEVENKAVGELLLAHNIQTVSAYSAEEAEKVLEKQKVDCIILDLNLPGMKGYEWMEKIKQRKGISEIPIIIYSGKDLSEEEEVKLKKFANTVIIKNEYSYIRLLDEVQLFLHKINQKLPLGNEFKMKLHVPEQILKGKKVLVVDDDVRNVYSLYSLLEMQGMDIVVANDGKEALEKINTEKGIDIVLMDIMMPEMDGIEATKRIRQNFQFKDLPIIALTAKAMKGDKEKCIQAGASDYIPKPVDTDKLLTLMRVWLYDNE